MTASPKCRAQGGPDFCADPDCPERNHKAAREAQERTSFLTGMLQSVGLKAKPDATRQALRDMLDGQKREEDALKARIAAVDASRSRRTYKQLLEDPEADVEQGLVDAAESLKREKAYLVATPSTSAAMSAVEKMAGGASNLGSDGEKQGYNLIFDLVDEARYTDASKQELVEKVTSFQQNNSDISIPGYQSGMRRAIKRLKQS